MFNYSNMTVKLCFTIQCCMYKLLMNVTSFIINDILYICGDGENWKMDYIVVSHKLAVERNSHINLPAGIIRSAKLESGIGVWEYP